MDDMVVRSRIPRQNVHARKRKKHSTRESGKLPELLLKQTFVAVLILLMAVTVKNIKTSATDYLSNRVRELVTHNIEAKKLYEGVEGFFEGLSGKKPVEGIEQKAGGDIQSVDGQAEVANTEALEMVMPVEGAISSMFGDRVHPVKNTIEFHSGVDIDANGDVPIKAALGGTVAEEGEKPEYGRYVKIQHEDGMATVYAHCSGINVEKGDRVEQGQVIATVGDTGNAVGTHLHFEVWKDGKALDPLDFIQGKQE